jgi:hypothetical protein
MTRLLPFFLAVVLLAWMPVVAFGQADNWWSLRTMDSTGFVPVERLELTNPSDATSWWQRTVHNHLFDFSDTDRSQNLIVVDPVVQAYAGSIQTTDAEGNPQSRSWWDNIRGARFQGIIDGEWHVGGELLERQGLAEPLLGFWATDYRIPGWGRAKLGKDGGFNSIDDAYFDVMFTRGWVGRQHRAWGLDAGVDALHIGAGRTSAFLSRHAVPAPYMRVTHQGVTHRTSLWSTRWMSTRRGTLGETAESLLERSRAIFLTHQQHIGSRFMIQGVYNFSWEATRQEAAGGWEALGFQEGEQYTPTRHVAGLDVQVHQRIAAARLTAYAQQSLTWIGSTRSVAPLSRVVGIHATSDRWMVRAEWTEREASHCRNCHTIADGSFGPIQTELSNAGINLHSLWNESLRVESRMRIQKRWMVRAAAEQNDLATAWHVDVLFELQPTWPMRLWMGVAQCRPEAADAPFEGYTGIRFGVHAGVLNWN